jgi:hypothetical protein
VIAAFEQCEAGRKNRRHAGAGGNAAFPAFQCRETLLEGAYRGIGKTRVDVPRLLARKPRRCLRRAFEHVAGRGEDRLGILALIGSMLARAHRAGIEAPIIRIVRHGLLLLDYSCGAGWRWDTGIKKAANAARAGTLALAAFVSRPQAEAQIGAYKQELNFTCQLEKHRSSINKEFIMRFGFVHSNNYL